MASHRSDPQLVGGKPVMGVARLTIVALAVYFVQFATTVLAADDRFVLGVRGLDARPLYYAAAAAGLVYAVLRHADWARWCWLILMTACTWGRALSLVVLGAPSINRSRELTGATAWAIAFLAGTLAALVLTAAGLLERDHLQRT